MSTENKVLKFPLGSSENMDRQTAQTLQTTVRHDLRDIVVVGIDPDGGLVIVHDPYMGPEKVAFILSKAVKRLTEEPLEADDDEEPDEDDGA